METPEEKAFWANLNALTVAYVSICRHKDWEEDQRAAAFFDWLVTSSLRMFDSDRVH